MNLGATTPVWANFVPEVNILWEHLPEPLQSRKS
jgi:hypothetical protein